MPNITITNDLRDLLRITRREVAGLTQRGAGLAAGGLSEVWWRTIESGRTEHAPAETLARMSYAIGVTPDQLRAIGEDELADLVERRLALLEPETTADSMDDHLMATPGLTEAQRAVLVTVAHGLQTQQTPLPHEVEAHATRPTASQKKALEG